MFTFLLELATIVFVLAFYTSYQGNIPASDIRSSPEKDVDEIADLEMCLFLLDHDIIKPVERLERSLAGLLDQHRYSPPVIPADTPSLKRKSISLFRYTPAKSPKTNHTVYRGKENQEFDMTKLKKLNKYGVNTDRDPKLFPWRNPLSRLNCNSNSRRYPTTGRV